GIPPSPSAAPLQAQSGHPLPTTRPPTLGAEQYIEKDKYCLYLILIIISISALTSKQIPKEDFHGIHPVPYHRRRSRGRHPAGLLGGGAHRHRPQAVAVLEPRGQRRQVHRGGPAPPRTGGPGPGPAARRRSPQPQGRRGGPGPAPFGQALADGGRHPR